MCGSLKMRDSARAVPYTVYRNSRYQFNGSLRQSYNLQVNKLIALFKVDVLQLGFSPSQNARLHVHVVVYWNV